MVLKMSMPVLSEKEKPLVEKGWSCCCDFHPVLKYKPTYTRKRKTGKEEFAASDCTDDSYL